jgi:hypothetical protein
MEVISIIGASFLHDGKGIQERKRELSNIIGIETSAVTLQYLRVQATVSAKHHFSTQSAIPVYNVLAKPFSPPLCMLPCALWA